MTSLALPRLRARGRRIKPPHPAVILAAVWLLITGSWMVRLLVLLLAGHEPALQAGFFVINATCFWFWHRELRQALKGAGRMPGRSDWLVSAVVVITTVTVYLR